MWAAGSECAEVVAQLLEHGADVDAEDNVSMATLFCWLCGAMGLVCLPALRWLAISEGVQARFRTLGQSTCPLRRGAATLKRSAITPTA